MAATFTIRETVTELLTMQCGECGVWHALPKVMYDRCVEEGGYWHCPNGHSRGYLEGRKERDAVRAERDRLKQAVAQKDDEIKAATEARTKAEAELRRNKTRIAKGVCTCCNRTFANLQRHMATKHPEQTGARN